MDASQHTETMDDLSALAWVQEELRRSLEAAHKLLRRHIKEVEAASGSDVGAVDPAVLRNARAQLHQGVGALELVGLPTAASVLRAAEAAVQRCIGRSASLNIKAVEAIEHASFALLDYLQRMLGGKAVSPLALFPQYRAVQQLAGADRVHPADLWVMDWRWRELPADASTRARAFDADARGEVEQQMLTLMRGPSADAAQRMSTLFAELGAGARDAQTATLWGLAAAFFDAQAADLLAPDVYGKRVASRLLAQLRAVERGDVQPSDRLAQDLLFFCAQCRAPRDAAQAPRLWAVRAAYGLQHSAPVDYEAARLGRFDPAVIAQARKRVAGAKDAWSAVAGGELHRLSSLNEQFSLVGDSLQRLVPQGDTLAQALLDAGTRTVQSADAPPAPLAMEVATGLLYLEASLEDAEFDDPAQGARVQRLAARIAAVAQGSTPEPLEPWMEELYRRVSDRQTMGSVVQELRGSLSEIEQQIDAYFRNPAERALLIPVPGQLQAMRGVLSVLGMDQASHAVLRMRDEVDVLANTEVDPARAAQTFDRLAGNLGALGFLIDMLSVQPQTAKSLFVFDGEQGTLSPVMGRQAKPSSFGALTLIEPTEAVEAAAPVPAAPALIEQAQSLAVAAASPEVPLETITLDLERLSQSALLSDQSVLAATVSTVQSALDKATDADSRHAVREELAQVMVDFVATASDASTLEPEIATLRATPVPPPAAPVPPGATGLEEDDEMREVFLEEAREVMQNAHDAMGVLADAPDNVGELTTVRRAFHTLKGSSRMVGLKDFGEAAWAFEQLYNARLADAPRADAPLLQLTLDALAYLGDWVDALAARRDGGHDAHAVKAAADALRLEGRSLALPLPGQGAVPQPPAAVEPIEIPVAIAIEAPAEEPIDAPTLVLSQPIALPEPVIELSLDLPSEEPIEAAALDLELAASAAEPVIEPLVPAALPAPEVQEISFELDLRALDEAPVLAAPAAAEPLPELSMPAPVEAAPPVVETMVDAAVEAANDDVDLEQVKVVGELRIGIPLFNIFLNEADEQSRRLSTELAEWALELHRPVGETAVALAHSLAGNSATVGFSDLSQLARSLEHALMRSQAIGFGDDVEARLFVEVADELRHLLHQFAAGFLKSPPPELLQRLAEHEVAAAHRMERQTAEASDSGAMPLVAPEPPPVAAELPVLTDEAPPADFAPTTGFGHLEELKPLDELPAVETLEAHAEHARPDALDNTDDIDAIDAVDAELFPIFEEEGQELLPQLASQVRDWLRRPGDAAGPTACMRTLHTLKGGARLAGAMRLGEMAHRLETNIEHLLARGDVHAADVETLQMRVDALASAFEALRSSDAQAYADASAQAAEALRAQLTAPTAHAPLAELKPIEAIDPLLREAPPVAQPIAAPTADSVPATTADIDWSRFVGRAPTLANVPLAERATALAAQAAVRVRAPLLDRLVNQAGEVSITRSRIESDVSQLKGSLGDLTENLERLRRQLRDIELQGETQISSRMEAAKAAAQAFDPLEMDRFTRFQELTRMMAESVNDVATVQRSLQRTLQSAEDELAAQARLTRDLQDDLLRTRMVEFEGMSERLYRVVRQAAKETGKHVRLDIVGGSIEIDRGVLDRMTGSFEHLLRNCLTHGIETPEQRTAAGKEATGLIVVALTHEGNEVAIEFRDDGRGLDLLAIRDKGVAQGLIEAGKEYSDAELADLIFKPGFSTASSVTELAGRGIGMDVVRAEVNAMGGRIETATAIGKGTSFKLVLPLTTAVTQVVMLRCGETTLAVPSTLIEIVRRAKPDEVAQCYASGTYTLGDVALPFFWLGALLQGSGRGAEGGRSLPVVVIRSAAQRIALHVDEVLGNQEVVVKNLGPQLSRLPGLAGMTLLASGAVALIYNPVALATLYGDTARALMIEAQSRPQLVEAGPEALVVQAPLVLVVDDSLTVRRVTQRLLVREGYRVSLAKDGLEALERLAEERPAVLLSDIEMPRMDGFDLVRNVRGDKQLSDLPVIMITSRIAQKHRDVASELGVDHYLGKPYSEEDLLALVSRYAGAAVAV